MTAFEARAPTTDDPLGPPRRVLVLYDTTAEGGAALAYADTRNGARSRARPLLRGGTYPLEPCFRRPDG